MVHRDGIPAWWLMTIGVVVGTYQGLSLVGNHPMVQRVANKLRVERIVTWMVTYPAWQSPGTKRFGRIAAFSVAMVALAWGVAKAIAGSGSR
jgi:hypothetical protein